MFSHIIMKILWCSICRSCLTRVCIPLRVCTNMANQRIQFSSMIHEHDCTGYVIKPGLDIINTLDRVRGTHNFVNLTLNRSDRTNYKDGINFKCTNYIATRVVFDI